MKDTWQLLILGDSLELLVDNRGKNPPYTESGVPCVSGMVVTDQGLDFSKARFVDEETWKQWMPEPLRKNDVVMTSEAPLGRPALIRCDEPIALTQRVFGMRGKEGVLDSRFLYYSLFTSQVRADLLGRATGTTVVGIRQPALKAVKIPAPSYDEQIAIAEVLGALDDKIAANTKLAASATSLAFYLYGGSLRGTENFYRRLDEVAINKPGKYLAKSDYETGGEYYVYGSNSVMGKHSEYLVEGAFTVLAKIGSYCGNLRWSQRPAWVNNNASAIVAKDSIDPWILGQALLRIDMQEHRAGTGQPYIQMDSLFSSHVAIPNEEISLQLAPKLKELAEVSTKHLEESESLAQIRDALLPHLMSGKMRVKDAEKVLEDVL